MKITYYCQRLPEERKYAVEALHACNPMSAGEA